MNSVFDKRYEIRQARFEEINEIMDFIENHWKKGHIFGKNREFFEYEFVIDGKVNFYIAKNRKTNEIESLQGFLYASHPEKKKDVWGSIWKTRTDHPNKPFLGLELNDRLHEEYGFRSGAGVGINPNTALPLNKSLGAYCSKMNHYYRLANCTEYKIAKIKEKIILPKNQQIKQITPQKVNSIDELKQVFDFSSVENVFPLKDDWYINHRFFNHPIYKYDVYSIPNAFFVTRVQEYNNSKILRIVDYLGDHSSFAGLYDFFEKLLNEYEYVDFYNLGFEHEYLEMAGFIRNEFESENIIPNYFAPFVQKNIEVYVSASNDKYIFFKADADQDRPN